MKDYGAHEGRLKAPRDCHDLPILNAPVSSVEPSIGNLFTISWGFDGDIEKHFNQPLYQLQELTQGLDLSSEEVIIDSAATEIDFSALETRQSGVYYYRVRACGAEAGIAVCTPWSQSTGHVIMGSEGISGSEAISNIDDDGFRSCLYDHLAYFENDELVYRKTGEVLALDCQSYLIKSLEGAHQFPNLVSLNFHDNEIEDLSPLQSVLQATHLDGQSVDLSLSSNQLEQTALNALVEYDSVYINLQLQDNPLGDIDSLTGLPSITNLNLNRTGISDLDPLREVQIESLSAAGNNISTIPNLFVQHELLVSDNVLNNIQGLNGNDPINKMPASLAMLDLSKNPVGQIPHYSDVLGSLALLQKLYLRDAGVDEIYFASSMSNLKDLDVSYNLLSDLSPLIGNLSLESLTANRTEITSLEPLAGLAQLASLKISGGDLSASDALAPLAGLPNLSELTAVPQTFKTALGLVAGLVAWAWAGQN